MVLGLSDVIVEPSAVVIGEVSMYDGMEVWVDGVGA